MRTETEISGEVAGITWQAEDASWQIARLKDGTKVVGTAVQPLVVGLTYTFQGQWDNHPRHGEEFRFSSASKTIPATKVGVVTYLVKNAPGVGPARAESLWDAFGSEAVRVLRENPESVADRGIMPLAVAQEASLELHKEGAFEKTMIELTGLLHGFGFHGSLKKTVLRLWKTKAPEIIRRNPYTLMVRRLPSAGFLRCDRLFIRLGGKAHRLKRQTLFAWHELHVDRDGHTWWPARRLVNRIVEIIGRERADPIRAIILGERSGWLSVRRLGPDDKWVAQADKARHEANLAAAVGGLSRWRQEQNYGKTPLRDRIRRQRNGDSEPT